MKWLIQISEYSASLSSFCSLSHSSYLRGTQKSAAYTIARVYPLYKERIKAESTLQNPALTWHHYSFNLWTIKQVSSFSAWLVSSESILICFSLIIETNEIQKVLSQNICLYICITRTTWKSCNTCRTGLGNVCDVGFREDGIKDSEVLIFHWPPSWNERAHTLSSVDRMVCLSLSTNLTMTIILLPDSVRHYWTSATAKMRCYIH